MSDWPCSAFLKSLPGQSDICIGHAAFMVIWPLQKSEHLYFLSFAERQRAIVKEVVKEYILCLYRNSRPHLLSTNHVNAELYRDLRIVKNVERRKVMRYRAQLQSSACLQRLCNCVTLSIRHPNHIFVSSIHLHTGLRARRLWVSRALWTTN
jgi:hypothetical protein